jgi:SnoaL-like domain
VRRYPRGMLAVIEAWHAAVNAGDGAAAGALCTDDVQVGGPRGSGRGRDLLTGWVGHAGVRLEARRWYCGSGGAVVEQDARWIDGATGEPSAPVRVATAFAVDHGRISRVLRHTELADALAVLGLTSADEVTERRPARR